MSVVVVNIYPMAIEARTNNKLSQYTKAANLRIWNNNDILSVDLTFTYVTTFWGLVLPNYTHLSKKV